ncbi:phosphotransferase [Lysinibacillus contaminans]|uniref:phosphotransferase n=1 Tax=Lysinibacillus contaminans TaxID=1293441 RepID=UPI001FDF5BA6|nr:phosphotransferase [Lysinibacillus contaminans]
MYIVEELKPNIWKYKYRSDYYFVKRAKQLEVAEKVKKIHQQLAQFEPSLALPLVPSDDEQLIVQLWQEGSHSADFSQKKDRKQALDLLISLHDTSKNVAWNQVPGLYQHSQLLKWQMRLMRFKSRRKELRAFLTKEEVTQILQYAEKAIRLIEMEDVQEKELTLLHGDVVHHNFLWCTDGKLRFIDFDLAHLGEPDDEYILWLHRVLPAVDYDLEKVLAELPKLKRLDKRKLHRLKFPNELLREWLYVLDLPLNQQIVFLDYLLPFTKRALTYWPRLWYDSDRFAET